MPLDTLHLLAQSGVFVPIHYINFGVCYAYTFLMDINNNLIMLIQKQLFLWVSQALTL